MQTTRALKHQEPELPTFRKQAKVRGGFCRLQANMSWKIQAPINYAWPRKMDLFPT
jgi:hypothetical protein